MFIMLEAKNSKIVLILATAVFILWTITALQPNSGTHEIFLNSTSFLTRDSPQGKDKNISVAIVICNKNGTGLFYQEASVLMKSVLISAGQNLIPCVNFHIFLEQNSSSVFFIEKIREYGLSNNSLQVNLKFHLAVTTVPKKYRSVMIYHKRWRCGFVRFFLPSAIPEVDSIIYLDSDTVVTGNIGLLWDQLNEMKSHQLIAAGRNNEENDKNFADLDKRLFADIPHVVSKGINSGVLVMNLTRMREYNWEEKYISIYNAYSRKQMTDQRVLNILLYYNPGLLRIIPCKLNFLNIHCTKGSTCKYAETDLDGIHLIHGTNRSFETGGVFNSIFRQYEKFILTKDDIREDLIVPIREHYKIRSKIKENFSPCYPVLEKYLYKNYSNE